MIQLSANLGFLWKELALPEAIHAAKAAGFDAVECHWPYDVAAEAVRAALEETGLSLLGLNTRRGREGENGLSALPGREAEARTAIDEAFDYGAEIGALAVHVMAGASRGVEGAREAFLEALSYAADLGGKYGMTVLIEPLNARDAPGYFHQTVEEAAAIVEALGRPEVRIMFDLYHQQIMGGDLLRRFERHRSLIGHVQFAAVPSRAEPDEGEVAFDRLLPLLDWKGPFGAEYRPRGATDDGLGWMRSFR